MKNLFSKIRQRLARRDAVSSYSPLCEEGEWNGKVSSSQAQQRTRHSSPRRGTSEKGRGAGGKGLFIPPIYVLALLSLLTGCGPKNEAANGTGPGNTAAGGAKEVRIAFFPNVTHGVALVGTGNGAFTKALGPNVKLEEQVFPAGPAEIEALFAGQVDIGYIGPGPAVNGFLKSKGKELRIVAGAASGGAGLVVRKDAGITDIKGLAGKRVAVPQVAGTQDIALRFALQKAGLNSTDKGGNVSVVAITPADALTLFAKKELDAAWMAEPWISRLIQEGNGTLLIDERDQWPQNKFSTTCVIMRTEFLEKNPELAQKFIKAHVETVDWINKNRSEAQKLIGERIKKVTTKALPDAILTEALSRTEFTADPLKDTVLETANRARSLGYQREDASLLANLFDLKMLESIKK